MIKGKLAPGVRALIEGRKESIAISITSKEQGEAAEHLLGNIVGISEHWFNADCILLISRTGFSEYRSLGPSLVPERISADNFFTFNEAFCVPKLDSDTRKYLWKHRFTTELGDDGKPIFLAFDKEGTLQLQSFDVGEKTYQEFFEGLGNQVLVSYETAENWGYNLDHFDFYEIKEPEKKYTWQLKDWHARVAKLDGEWFLGEEIPRYDIDEVQRTFTEEEIANSPFDKRFLFKYQKEGN